MIDIDFLENTVTAAKFLLGKEIRVGDCAGIITETEAYCSDDPSCHAYRGRTERNAPMFEKSGTVYVYFIYGMYMCLNIVTNRKNVGEAVLIRSVKPTAGTDIMKERRKTDNVLNLCSGPGKLCMAFEIDRSFSCTYIDEKLFLRDVGYNCGEIISSYRIGIKENEPKKLRFFLEKDKNYVSFPKK